jgi:hypothetical protein
MKVRYLAACAFLALIWHHICLDLREAVDFIKSIYAGTVIGPDHSQPAMPHIDKQQGLPPRPMAHWSVLGAPIFVMGQGDELTFPRSTIFPPS